MKEAQGNLWTFPADARVITTNGFVKNDGSCVMGRGCAKQARDMFPGIDKKLGVLIKRHGNVVNLLGPHGPDKAQLIAMPVKHNWWEEADIDLIKDSAHRLVQVADLYDYSNIVLPRPGCGNGKLSWKSVQPLLAAILDDRFTAICF